MTELPPHNTVTLLLIALSMWYSSASHIQYARYEGVMGCVHLSASLFVYLNHLTHYPLHFHYKKYHLNHIHSQKVLSLLSSSAKIAFIASPAEYLFPLPSAILQLQGMVSHYCLLLCFYPIYWTLEGGGIYTNISSYNAVKLAWIADNLAMLY